MSCDSQIKYKDEKKHQEKFYIHNVSVHKGYNVKKLIFMPFEIQSYHFQLHNYTYILVL
jgi:hypothetical protein